MKIKILLVVLFQVLISLNCIAQVADFEVEMKSLPGSKLELKIKNNTPGNMIITNDRHKIDYRSYLKVDYKNDSNEIIFSDLLSVGGNRLVIIIDGGDTWSYTYQLHSSRFDVSVAKKIHLTLVLNHAINKRYAQWQTKEFDLTYQK